MNTKDLILKNYEFHPLIISFGKKIKEGVSFVNLNDTVSIKTSQEIAKKILDISFWCNGYRTLDEIYALCNDLAREIFDELVKILKDHQIIIDSRNLYSVFHEYSRFPLTVAHDFDVRKIDQIKKEIIKFPYGKRTSLKVEKSHVLNLIKKRKSTRYFSGESLSFANLSGILYSIYGQANRKSFPSAGGFYSMKIFVLVVGLVRGLKDKGLYQYDNINNQLISIIKGNDIGHEQVSLVLGTRLIKNASIVIFITGDFAPGTFKYSNRGYRYLNIEAGHCAQNAYLYCAEKKIGIVEFGGFNDVEGARLLRLNFPQNSILTTLIVGMPESKKQKTSFAEDFFFEDSKIRENIFGKDKIIRSVSSKIFGFGDYRMPYHAACAKYIRYSELKFDRPFKLYSAFGVGATLLEARVKSMIEAYERYSSGVFRIEKECSALDLGFPCFDLNNLTHQSYKYTKKENLVRYNKNSKRAWVSGYKFSDKSTVYVPVDQVFYPLHKDDIGYPLSYKANSTGVAAHFSFEQAFHNALFELIERDAVAVFWYSKTPPPRIADKIFSDEIQRRVKILKKNNRNVYFFDLTLDTVTVILCLIEGDVYPHSTIGCSANVNYNIAALKALNEAEFIMHSWKSVNRKKKNLYEIRSSTDHGDLYSNIKISEHSKLKWFTSGHFIKEPKKAITDIKKIVNIVNPVVVDVNKDCREAGIYVIRVLSESLIPFTFGYMSEHYGHPRMKMLGLKWAWKFPSFPHLIA